MTTRKRAAAVAAAALACLLILTAFAAPGIQRAMAARAGDVTNPDRHYNDEVQNDGISWNNFNFGPNRFEWATEAIKKGDANSVLGFIYANDGRGKRGGDFNKSIDPHNLNPYYDGALLAAVCLHVENKTGKTILVDEQAEPIGKRADAAHLHFHEDRAYAEACYDRLMSILDHAEVYVVQIDNYTSSMYQWHDGLNGNMPSVVNRKSHNHGGHALVFDLGEKVGLIRFRLECGYQPIDTEEYWPTPPGPPSPPEPPDVPLDPKDPDAGPIGQTDPTTPGAEDFWGEGGNHDPMTELTNEPTSPDTPYVPPAPPAPETPTQPTEPHGQDEGGAVTPGHDTDYEGGGTESYTDPDTGETGEGTVVVGDGEDHGDFTEIVQEGIDDGSTTPEPGLDPGDGGGNDECQPPE